MTITRGSLTCSLRQSCGIPAREASVLRLGIARSAPRRSQSLLLERIARACAVDSVALGERLQSLWGGYGELWRAELTTAAGVSSAIVKDVQPPLLGNADRSHRRKLRSYAVEHAFYQRYVERCLATPGCRVARPIGLLAEPGRWLFVLEDLDASGFGARRARPAPADILATLRWLASFHARFLGTPPDQLWKVGSYWQLGGRPDELSAMRHDALREAAAHIDARLNGARFKTLVHGDAKLENVCFAPDGDAVAMVDFQYVGAGVGVKDVAYFLSGCLTADECRAAVPMYLDAYFRELGASVVSLGASIDARELEREWRELFPLAWVDFYRFLLGWAPGQLDRDPYSEQLTTQVLRDLGSR
jgi:hypothetical protein